MSLIITSQTNPKGPGVLSAFVALTLCLWSLLGTASYASSPKTLVLFPAGQTLAMGESFYFQASGGSAPYTYTVYSGSGTIDPATGLFTTSNHPGAVTVRITDSAGEIAESYVTAVASVLPDNHSIQIPSEGSIESNSNLTTNELETAR